MQTEYTAKESQLPRQVQEYLVQHGVWLSWHFHDDTPPTQEVKQYLEEIADALFDLDGAEEIVVNRAIELIDYLL